MEEYEKLFESHENQIKDLISRIDFKNVNDINFDYITEEIKKITGAIPSVTPKWEIIKSANEDIKLDGSNKVVEKIASIDIVYMNNDVPTALKFLV